MGTVKTKPTPAQEIVSIRPTASAPWGRAGRRDSHGRVRVSIRPTASAPWGREKRKAAAVDAEKFQSAPRRQHRGDAISVHQMPRSLFQSAPRRQHRGDVRVAYVRKVAVVSIRPTASAPWGHLGALRAAGGRAVSIRPTASAPWGQWARREGRWPQACFNPPHGVSTVGTMQSKQDQMLENQFQSAPRRQHRGDAPPPMTGWCRSSFNPPHGVSTVGTAPTREHFAIHMFQSAPRRQHRGDG